MGHGKDLYLGVKKATDRVKAKQFCQMVNPLLKLLQPRFNHEFPIMAAIYKNMDNSSKEYDFK